MAIIKTLAAAALALSTALASYAPRTPEMPINYEPRVMPAPAAWSFVDVPREVQTPKPAAKPAAKRNAEPVCKVERRKLRMTGAWVTTWECAKLRCPCKLPSERGILDLLVGTEDEMKKIEMLYSDLSYGTKEYGFIPRGRKTRDEDSEDLRYARYLRTFGVEARVANGYVFLA